MVGRRQTVMPIEVFCNMMTYSSTDLWMATPGACGSLDVIMQARRQPPRSSSPDYQMRCCRPAHNPSDTNGRTAVAPRRRLAGKSMAYAEWFARAKDAGEGASDSGVDTSQPHGQLQTRTDAPERRAMANDEAPMSK